MAVEARSLSSISLLANSPPKDAAIKHATEESAISFYIAAVPGKKDLGLSPVKPGARLKDWDISSMVYLLRFDDVESYQHRARQWGTFGRVARQEPSPGGADSDDVSRKSLPSTAKVHPALNSGRTSSSDPHNTFNPELHIPLELLADADSFEPETLGIPPERVFNAAGASVAELDVIGPQDSTISLIRRGQSWSEPETVARMLDPHSKNGVSGSLTSGRPAFIDILNPAYDVFGQHLKYTEPEGGQCLTRRMYQEVALTHPKLVFLTPWKDFCVFETTKAYMDCYRVTRSKDGLANPVKVLVSRLSFNMQRTVPLKKTRDRSRSLLKDSPNPHAHPHPHAPHPSAIYASQANSNPTRSNSVGDHNTARHTRMLARINDAVNPALEKAAESKNLKRISALIPGRRARPTHAIESEKSLRRASLDASNSAGNSSQSPERTNSDEKLNAEYALMSKGFGAIAGLGQPNPSNQEEAEFEDVEEETLGIDSAKLGKLVVHAAGLDFLDLVVAANMVVFTRVYETVRVAEGKK